MVVIIAAPATVPLLAGPFAPAQPVRVAPAVCALAQRRVFPVAVVALAWPAAPPLAGVLGAAQPESPPAEGLCGVFPDLPHSLA